MSFPIRQSLPPSASVPVACCCRRTRQHASARPPPVLAGWMLLLAVFLAISPLSTAIPPPKASTARSRGQAAARGRSNDIRLFERAVERAKREQAVEDFNSLLKLQGGPVFSGKPGLFLVMPLTDVLDPMVGHMAHGKIQHADKVLMPRWFQYELLGRRVEPPWIFEMTRIDSDDIKGDTEEEANLKAVLPTRSRSEASPSPSSLKTVACSPLDFRGPQNYLFLPNWMMKAMDLRPRDVVSLKLAHIPEGGLIRLRPHSSSFQKFSNHQAVLESELKFYSAATKGTTIAFKYDNKEYFMDVVDTEDENGDSVPSICIQDTDVRTDILDPLPSTSKLEADKVKDKEEAPSKGTGDKE